MRRHRLALAALVLCAPALALAGCASAGSDAGATGDGRLSVVASTDVYGQIVSEIAGDLVDVTAIIVSTAQDPHEYEATAQDQLTVQRAALIVENGGGYDAFMDGLTEAAGSAAPVIVAAEYSHSWPGGTIDEHHTEEPEPSAPAAEEHDHEHEHQHVEGFNEHVWYDPHTMVHLAEAVAEELSALLPEGSDEFAANLGNFSAQVEELEAGLADIEAAHAGAEVFVTEPVPGYLVTAAGLVNATPDAFSEAVEEGQDVPPATLLEALDEIGSGHVSVVIANSQTGGAETTRVLEAAEAAGIPVLEFSETLPEGDTYIRWMQQNIDDLAAALAT